MFFCNLSELKCVLKRLTMRDFLPPTVLRTRYLPMLRSGMVDIKYYLFVEIFIGNFWTFLY